jgi:hypothetical protein
LSSGIAEVNASTALAEIQRLLWFSQFRFGKEQKNGKGCRMDPNVQPRGLVLRLSNVSGFFNYGNSTTTLAFILLHHFRLGSAKHRIHSAAFASSLLSSGAVETLRITLCPDASAVTAQCSEFRIGAAGAYRGASTREFDRKESIESFKFLCD